MPTQLASPTTLHIIFSVAEGITSPLLHVHHVQIHTTFSFLAKGQSHIPTSPFFQPVYGERGFKWTSEFWVLSFLPDLFSSETLLRLQLNCSLEVFDPTVSGLGSKLISFQMVPMGSKTPMQQVLKLRMLEGGGNDLLVFFRLKDVFE